MDNKHSNCWAVAMILSKPSGSMMQMISMQMVVWADSQEQAIGKGYLDAAKTAKEKYYNIASVTAMELDFDLLGLKLDFERKNKFRLV